MKDTPDGLDAHIARLDAVLREADKPRRSDRPHWRDDAAPFDGPATIVKEAPGASSVERVRAGVKYSGNDLLYVNFNPQTNPDDNWAPTTDPAIFAKHKIPAVLEAHESWHEVKNGQMVVRSSAEDPFEAKDHLQEGAAVLQLHHLDAEGNIVEKGEGVQAVLTGTRYRVAEVYNHPRGRRETPTEARVRIFDPHVRDGYEPSLQEGRFEVCPREENAENLARVRLVFSPESSKLSEFYEEPSRVAELTRLANDFGLELHFQDWEIIIDSESDTFYWSFKLFSNAVVQSLGAYMLDAFDEVVYEKRAGRSPEELRAAVEEMGAIVEDASGIEEPSAEGGPEESENDEVEDDDVDGDEGEGNEGGEEDEKYAALLPHLSNKKQKTINRMAVRGMLEDLVRIGDPFLILDLDVDGDRGYNVRYFAKSVPLPAGVCLVKIGYSRACALTGSVKSLEEALVGLGKRYDVKGYFVGIEHPAMAILEAQAAKAAAEAAKAREAAEADEPPSLTQFLKDGGYENCGDDSNATHVLIEFTTARNRPKIEPVIRDRMGDENVADLNGNVAGVNGLFVTLKAGEDPATCVRALRLNCGEKAVVKPFRNEAAIKARLESSTPAAAIRQVIETDEVRRDREAREAAEESSS